MGPDEETGTKFLFPHRIITTMSIADAEALQKRLIAIEKLITAATSASGEGGWLDVF